MARRAECDEKIIAEWCVALKGATDAALSTLDRLESEGCTEAVFQEYIDVLYEYGVYHRIIKVMVDYIDADILNKNLEALTDARVYAEPVYERTEKFTRNFAVKLSEKYGIESRYILAMTADQYRTLLATGTFPELDVLNRQDDLTLLFMEDGKASYFFGDEAEIIESRMFGGVVDDEIHGATAYTGRVTGKVRIILDATKEQPFDDGEILVTGMTRPEYLPYIRKSAGFVTDAGGLLSHAAISARELKKPCVIGTENATRVLRDGDLVEVDADHGVVRIIARNNI